MSVLMPQAPAAEIARDTPPEITLTREERDRIAELALCISQNENRRQGNLEILVSYHDRTEAQKAAARLTVVRIVQAMTMLGYLEKP